MMMNLQLFDVQTKKYKVLETTFTSVNGHDQWLYRNMELVTGPTGAVVAVDCEGTDLELGNQAIQSLINAGVVIEIEEETEDDEESDGNVV